MTEQEGRVLVLTPYFVQVAHFMKDSKSCGLEIAKFLAWLAP